MRLLLSETCTTTAAESKKLTRSPSFFVFFFLQDTVSDIGSAAAIQANDVALDRRVTGQSGLDRVSTRGDRAR